MEYEPLDEVHPIYGPFFGVMGAASAIIFTCEFSITKNSEPYDKCLGKTKNSCKQPFNNVGLGAAYGTAKSGTGIAAMSVLRPDLIMKSIIPVVMAGIIAIYGLVVAVLIAGQLAEPKDYPLFK